MGYRNRRTRRHSEQNELTATLVVIVKAMGLGCGLLVMVVVIIAAMLFNKFYKEFDLERKNAERLKLEKAEFESLAHVNPRHPSERLSLTNQRLEQKKTPVSNSAIKRAYQQGVADTFHRLKANSGKQWESNPKQSVKSVSVIHHKLSFESQDEAIRFAKNSYKSARRIIQAGDYDSLRKSKYLFKKLLLGREALTIVKGRVAEARVLKQRLEAQINKIRSYVSTSDWIHADKEQILTMLASVKLLGDPQKLVIVRKQGIGHSHKYVVTVFLRNENPSIIKDIRVIALPHDVTHDTMEKLLLSGPRALSPGETARYYGSYFGEDADKIEGLDVLIKVE